jgi:hypothetical protein
LECGGPLWTGGRNGRRYHGQQGHQVEDPQWVRLCLGDTLDSVAANAVKLRKKRAAETKVAELIGKVVAA